MPVIIRNPFRRNAPPLLHTSTEPTLRRLSSSSGDGSDSGTGTTEELDKAFPPASKSTGAISIKATDEANSYKMSVVNDSGVYLPPSPPAEKKAFWKMRPETTSTAKNRPPVTPVDDAFTISKESFDSYRRSFDISARSPITDGTGSARVSMDQGRPTRASLDVRPARSSFDIRPSTSRLSLDARPRGSIDSRSPRLPPTVKDVEEPKEGEFEDVKLHDDPRPKRSLFHPFGGEASGASSRVLSKSALFTRKEPVVTTAHESELARIDSQRVLEN